MTRLPDALELAPATVAHGTVRVPGSKSISIRALLLAALSDGMTTIEGLLRSDDTTVMIDALRTLGVPITDDAKPPTTVTVRGARDFPKRNADLFVGNSGLSIRTLTAALAFADGSYRLTGVTRMHERPIGDLVDALSTIGARIAFTAVDGFPPLSIEPARLGESIGGRRVVRIAAHASSQFLTGVLHAAPMLARDADLSIEVEGALISRPYVDLTIALMRCFGVEVSEGPIGSFHVARGATYAAPGRFVVEGDASSASYLLAAGLLGGGPVEVVGVGRSSLQGDARFVDVLVAMCAEVIRRDDTIVVSSPGTASGFRPRAIDADFNHIPDAAMSVAVLALFANGPCTLRNIGSWRVKETDRIAAMATELAKFGAVVGAGNDWLRVEPLSVVAVDRLRRGDAISIATYDDHRIAMSFSLARFLGIPVRIEDPGCVAKTFPDYFACFETLVASSNDVMPIHRPALQAQ